MSRLAVTILFALCISQDVNAGVLSNPLTDVVELKKEVDTTMKIFKLYTEQFFYEFIETQDNAKNEFEARLNKEINATFDEVKNAAQEKGNSTKINQYVEAAKEKLDNLKINLPKDVQNCIESQQEEEVDDFFNKLIEEVSTVIKIKSLIKSLERDVKTNNGRDVNVERKISGVRASVELLQTTGNDLMENGNKILGRLQIQTQECSDNQSVHVHSTVVAIKEDAFVYISEA